MAGPSENTLSSPQQPKQAAVSPGQAGSPFGSTSPQPHATHSRRGGSTSMAMTAKLEGLSAAFFPVFWLVMVTLFMGALSSCAARPLFGSFGDGCTSSSFGLSCARCSVHPLVFVVLSGLIVVLFRLALQRFSDATRVAKATISHLSTFEAALVAKDVMLSSAQSSVDAYHRISEDLRSSNAQLQLEYSSRSAELAEARARVLALEERASLLDDRASSAESQLLLSSGSQASVLARELEQARARVAELTEDISAVRAAVSAAEQRATAAEQRAAAAELHAQQQQADRVQGESRAAAAAESASAAAVALAEARHACLAAEREASTAQETLALQAEDLAAVRAELAAARKRNESQDEVLATAREALAEAQTRAAAAAAEVATLRDIQTHGKSVGESDSTIASLSAKLVAAATETAEARHAAAAAEREAAEAIADAEAARAAAAAAAADADAAHEELAGAREAIVSLQHSVAAAQSEAHAAVEEAAGLREEIEALRAEAGAGSSQGALAVARAEAEADSANTRAEEAEARAAAAETRAEAAEARARASDAALAAAEQRLNTAVAGGEGREDELSELRARVLGLEEEHDELVDVREALSARLRQAADRERELEEEARARAEEAAAEAASARALREEAEILREDYDTRRIEAEEHYAEAEALRAEVEAHRTEADALRAEAEAQRAEAEAQRMEASRAKAAAEEQRVEAAQLRVALEEERQERLRAAAERAVRESMHQGTAEGSFMHGAAITNHAATDMSVHNRSVAGSAYAGSVRGTPAGAGFPPSFSTAGTGAFAPGSGLFGSGADASVVRAAADLNHSRLVGAINASNARAAAAAGNASAVAAGDEDVNMTQDNPRGGLLSALGSPVQGGFLSPVPNERKQSSHMLFSPSPGDAIRFSARAPPSGAPSGFGATQQRLAADLASAADPNSSSAASQASAAAIAQVAAQTAALHASLQRSVATPAAAGPYSFTTPAAGHPPLPRGPASGSAAQGRAVPSGFTSAQRVPPLPPATAAGSEVISPTSGSDGGVIAPGTVGIRVEEMPKTPAPGLKGRNIYASGGMSRDGKPVSALSMEPTPEEGPEGLRIKQVDPGTFASHSGLKEGDVLLSMDSRRIANMQTFIAAKQHLRPGREVPFVVRRDGVIHVIYVGVAQKGKNTVPTAYVPSVHNRQRPATGSERDAYP